MREARTIRAAALGRHLRIGSCYLYNGEVPPNPRDNNTYELLSIKFITSLLPHGDIKNSGGARREIGELYETLLLLAFAHLSH